MVSTKYIQLFTLLVLGFAVIACFGDGDDVDTQSSFSRVGKHGLNLNSNRRRLLENNLAAPMGAANFSVGELETGCEVPASSTAPLDVDTAQPKPMPVYTNVRKASEGAIVVDAPSKYFPGERGSGNGRTYTYKSASSSNATANGIIADAVTYSGNYPFTTRAAHAQGSSSPTNLYPWSASGKLIIKGADGETYVCSASLIKPGLVVTAAHCIAEFGIGFNFNTIEYIPSFFDGNRPYGSWFAKRVWIPNSYLDGTDVCDPASYGVVCENDLAIIVLKTNSAGKYPGKTTGYFGFATNAYSFTLNFVNYGKAGHITCLGYPGSFSNGKRMVRNEGICVTKSPSVMEGGSSTTQGYSGGPWLVNFGADVQSNDDQGRDSKANLVVGVTSYGDENVLTQGASLFGTNRAYTTKSNIESLIDSACNYLSDATVRCQVCNIC